MIDLLFIRRIKLSFLFASLFLAQNLFALGVTGHRVVAEIAQRHLTSKAKKELFQLIGKESLALWANWPDFIKSDTTHTWDHTSLWHYVNMPGNLGKETFVEQLKNLQGENLYTQIQAMVKQLKNKSLPLQQRQIALRFLIHLVGDLHQPLHVGREEDQGGNKITVYWFEKKTNLHSVWDSDLIDFQKYSYTEYANVLDIEDKNQVWSWQQSSLEDWFYESHVLANKVYQKSPAETKLGYGYNYIFQNDLDNLLLKGGVRLAALLNEVLK